MLHKITRLWNIVLMSSVLMNTACAWTMYLAIDKEDAPVSQIFLRQFAPDEIWPALFFISALLAAAGMWHPVYARAHFLLGGILMVVFGITLIAVTRSPIPNAGALLLIHFAVLKIAFVYYIPYLQRLGMLAYTIFGRLDEIKT